jgi:aspartate-semialdehyde dehydrogenase
MVDDKLPVAVMGATGMVGQRFLQLLRDHPYFELAAVCASQASAGKTLKERLNLTQPGVLDAFGNMVVTQPDPAELAQSGIKVAFSALPADTAGDIERGLAEKGVCVFSNARSNRNSPNVPILIPEINLQHLEAVKDQGTPGFIVTNSNCTTSGLVMVMKPIMDGFGLKEVVVSTYQALSGAGYPGVSSMDITGNVLPHIGGEEEKMETESKRMMGSYDNGAFNDAQFDITTSCVRVAVKDGHTETVTFKTEREASTEDISNTLKEFKGQLAEKGLKLPTQPISPIIVTDQIDRPQPILDVWNGEPERARGMAVTVGRIKKVGPYLRLVLLVHNTIRGAAGDSVLNAELAYKLGYIH